nr:hypothetical protein [Tanacetum cinerariifolium]GEY38439.1 hypothetical protein [Tanacetum cinerariifolium]
MREKDDAMWDGGKGTWGGRAKKGPGAGDVQIADAFDQNTQ